MRIRNERHQLNGSLMSNTSMNRAIGLNMVFLASLPQSAGCSSEGLDTTPPTAPTVVGAAAPGSSQINLSWAAATDNVGVTGYRVERCQGTGCASFVQIATPAGTTFGDTGLTASTTYSYRVKAVDAATNVSVNYSTVANVATQAAGTATQPIDGWTVTSNGVPGTSIVDTDGYTGEAGNRRFRIYYWLNLPPGLNTVVGTNLAADITPNELAVSVVLLGNVAQASPLGAIALDVSTSARTGKSETAPTTTNDLGVHAVADALIVRGTLGNGETPRSVANDGAHPADGDASLWVSTKPGELSSMPVSSSGWASRVINGAAIVVHGLP